MPSPAARAEKLAAASARRSAARLGQGKGLQVAHQAGEQAGFVQCGGEILRSRLVDPIQHPLQVALDDVQRVAQLVSNVGRQIAALDMHERAHTRAQIEW